ncbi:PAS domain-containing protein [Pontibacter vulgaris]|uniref:PAS domain-containing protein n=1 Tax=Pontibacter vulgaris TaxID=2905679 RepID=UPI001FA6EB69|nr:PAS domain-containing protein [Pontibacter vulgaris]
MTYTTSLSPELLAVFETVPDLYLILDTDLNILTASNNYLQAAYREREKIKGKNVFEVFPDNPAFPESESTINLSKSLNWVLEHKKPHQMPLIRYDVSRNGSTGDFEEKYWQTVNTPVLDQQGNILYIIHRVTDVTAQVDAEKQIQQLKTVNHKQLQDTKDIELKAEAAVKHQRDLLQALLDQAPVAMSLYRGTELEIATANPAMCQLWGRTQEQVIGKPLMQVLPELEGQGFDQKLREIYTTGVPFIGKEAPASMLRNGEIQTNYFNYVYHPLYNEQGSLLGVFNVAVEVTELVIARKKVEESERKLRVLNSELEAANSEIIASNKELQTANKELLLTQQALQKLNRELEDRVAYRTSELQLAKAEAESERNRLQDLFMQAATPISILRGEDLVYELVNPAYQQLLPGRQLLGNSMLKVALSELESHPFANNLREVYRTGKTFVSQEDLVPLARYEGGPMENRYFSYTLQPRRNEQGEVNGIFIFVSEVTEQVEARRTVENSAERLQLITDALPVLIGYLDKEEKYQFANKAYEAWFNIKPEDLIGRPVREVVGDAAYQGVKKYIDRALAGERLDFESRMPYREDFVKYISTNYVPDIRNGEVVGFYTLVTDITSQVEAIKAIEEGERQAKTMAEELRITNEQLILINVDLDNFIYTASHDLKAPIANIEGLIRILIESLPASMLKSEGLEGVMDMIEGSIKRFKRTIDHLTEVVKLQKENNQDAVLVDLPEVIQEITMDLSPQIKEAGAKLEIEIEDCLGINFSAKNLRSVIYNLISNAVKYRSPERDLKIQVNCHTEAEYILFTVQDNGLGMDLDGNQKLFTMFGRLHDHVEGSGIGLYMVKKIIENAGGRIEVESKVGKGTTFRVYFRNSNN